MGCDGGTIPKRDELVKVKKKPEAKDKQAELSFQWKCCAITQEILQPPVVTCGYGKLYNKSAVLEGLLNRLLLPECAEHIKSLKDIKDLKLTPNPEFDSNAEKPEGSIDSRAAPYICPISGLEMSGKFRFVCLWKCGCVLAERALKQLNTNICPNCQTAFAPETIIVLNGNEADIEIMKENMLIRQSNLKAARKAKKNDAETSAVPNKKLKPSSTITSSTNSESCIGSSPSSSSEILITASSSSTNSNTAYSSNIISSTSNSCVVSSSSASSGTISSSTSKRPADSKSLVDPKIDKMKTGYSVAKDPKVTDVYKSLFTSHKSEKQQTRAHWVTYNPFYN